MKCLELSEKLIFCLTLLTPSLCSATIWTAQFDPINVTLHMHESQEVHLSLKGLNYNELLANQARLYVRTDDEKELNVNLQIVASDVTEMGSWAGPVHIEALFLGNPKIYVELINANGSSERADQQLPVVIIREDGFINHLFVGSVAGLVSILYINFGAALSVQKLRGIVSRPIGPAIGFSSQFILMPLLSYGLGIVLFPDNVEMQLGMFFTGVSPAGGASNIWTVLLGGNMDLSITMTAISNIASFAMMPLWLFTLGKTIFDRGEIPVPYATLSGYIVALIIPLAIGLAIQRFMPRVSAVLVRILKPMSMLLILFIVIFAIVTNLYLFELFSWQIIVGGLCLPWLGYVLGYLTALIFRQSAPDCTAIALETGIQNTGIAIFLLRFTLSQPAADLTTVMPVSVAIMTPIPLLCVYIYQKIYQSMVARRNKGEIIFDQEEGARDGCGIDVANGGNSSTDLLDDNRNKQLLPNLSE